MMPDHVFAVLGVVTSLVSVLAVLIERRRKLHNHGATMTPDSAPVGTMEQPRNRRIQAVRALKADVEQLHRLAEEAAADRSLSPEELHRLRQLLERIQREAQRASSKPQAN